MLGAWFLHMCIANSKARVLPFSRAASFMITLLPAAHVHTSGGIRQANTAIVRSLSVMTLTAFPITTLKGASSRTTASKGCTFICFTQHVASSLWHGMRHARVCLAVS